MPTRSTFMLQFVAALALIGLATLPVLAQGSNESDSASSAARQPVMTRDVDGRIVVRATRIDHPINIDGRLDEPIYEDLQAITEFIQQEPVSGAPISERTEVWVLFDDRHIYVVCRCWYADPTHIVANDMRRDSSNLRWNDSFTVAFDTFHDRRDMVSFGITPLGGIYDTAASEVRPSSIDWNAVWEGRAARFENGWAAEIAIPFKSLRYRAGRQQTWGIQLRRVLPSKNERAYLSPVSPAWGMNGFSNVSAAATLEGLEVPPAGRNLEIKPYAISQLTTDLLSRPASRNHVGADAGIDVKYGITKNLTADFTYNTDFAHVEADEAQINLTRFNLLFPEKREFFLEGAGIFGFGRGGSAGADAPAIFYSRRIGISGTKAVPIVGGGRLTGKAGPFNVGLLNVTTDDVPSDGIPQTTFTAARLQRDVLRRSSIGAIYTRRSVSTVASGANDVLGADANFALRENVFIDVFAAKSRTPGLRGRDMSYRTRFNYNSDRYGLTLDRITVEPNFNPELGFLRRENFRRSFLLGRFSPRPERAGLVRKFGYEGTFEYITDTDGRLESREAKGEFKVELASNDVLSVQYFDLFEALPAPFQISEGVRIPAGGYAFRNGRIVYSVEPQRRLSGTASLEVGSFYDGTKTTTTYRGRVEVTPQLGIEPNISLNWIDLPQGRFTTTIIGSRTTFTMTPRMFVAALVQYASSNTSISTNLRFRWEYQPGSELFVVYTDVRDTFPPRRVVLENRGVVVKINRLFRF